MLTEFGGIALSEDANATWGYSRATNSADLAQRYAKLLTAVRGVQMFGGFCYTQFTDTYQEANGLVTMDRRPKVDPALIAIATRGPHNPTEAERLQSVIDGTVSLKDAAENDRPARRHEATRKPNLQSTTQR